MLSASNFQEAGIALLTSYRCFRAVLPDILAHSLQLKSDAERTREHITLYGTL